MKLFELNDEFFRPVWKRVLIVAATVGWACFEFYSGQTFWGVIFLGIGVYAIYGLFIAFDPDKAAQDGNDPD